MSITEQESVIRALALIKSFRDLNVDLLEELKLVSQDSGPDSSKNFNAFMDRNFPGTRILSTTNKRNLIKNLPTDIQIDIDAYNSVLKAMEQFLNGQSSFLLVYLTVSMYKEHLTTVFTPDLLSSGIVISDLLDVYVYMDAEKILQKAMSAEMIHNCQKYFNFGFIPENKQPFVKTNEVFNKDYNKLVEFLLSEELLRLMNLPENRKLQSDYMAALTWVDSEKNDGMKNFLEFLQLKEFANKLSPGFFAEEVGKLPTATTQETPAPEKNKNKNKKNKKKKKKSATDAANKSDTAQETQEESDSEEQRIAQESSEPIEPLVIQSASTTDATVEESSERKRQLAAYKQEVQDKRDAKTAEKKAVKQDRNAKSSPEISDAETKKSLKIKESVAEKYLDQLRILFAPETREMDYSETIRMLCGDPAIKTTGLGLTQFNRKGSHLRLEYSDRTVGTVRLTVVDPHAKGNSTKILGYNLKSLRRAIRDLLPEKIMADLQLAPGAFVSENRRKARPN